MTRALLVLTLAACGSATKPAAPAQGDRKIVSSNVLRKDYAGSESCADCHAEIYKKWASSPIRSARWSAV